MTIATCGHEVNEGITMSVHSFSKEGDPCFDYGTYCANCFYEYYAEGRVANEELHDFMRKLIGSNDLILDLIRNKEN